MKIIEWFKQNKKKSIFAAIILAVILWNIFASGNKSAEDTQTDTVKRTNLKQTVLATGQVTSQTDLSLSFKTSGVVDRVNVKVGDKVKAGQILANIDQRNEVARLTQARGTLKQAEANYQKVLDGSSNEQIAVYKVALDNAKIALENTKKQQKVLVDNSYKALLNSTLEAVPDPANLNNVTLTVSGSYNSTQQGQYKIIQEGQSFYVNGLEVAGNQNFNSSVSSPLPVGTRGLYVQFPSSMLASNDEWVINIPNTQASNYVTNYNAYQSALETQTVAIASAENAVATASANLDLQRAAARPAELDAVLAVVLTAQGQVQLASADLENTIMRAPADGTITKVDAKPGQLATASQALVVLQDVGNLHIEANISEANIASVVPGQTVDVNFDALGNDRKFVAKVQTVDPASTLVSGVVNYKVTVSLDKLDEIKPGMTANVTILTAQKDGVLSMPLRGIITQDGKKYARIVTNKETKAFEQKEVTTGLEADGGLVEIVSGLNEGDEVVTFVKVSK